MADEQGQGRPRGDAIDAIGQRQAALTARHTASVDADLVLADVLGRAHSATVESVRRLDAIAAEIDGAVDNQAALALDTAMGAREFQKFLIAKQQEISAVVSHARDIDAEARAALDTLRGNYAAPAG